MPNAPARNDADASPVLPLAALILIVAGTGIALKVNWLVGLVFVVASMVVAGVGIRQRARLRPLAIAVLAVGATMIIALAVLIGRTLFVAAQVSADYAAYGM